VAVWVSPWVFYLTAITYLNEMSLVPLHPLPSLSRHTGAAAAHLCGCMFEQDQSAHWNKKRRKHACQNTTFFFLEQSHNTTWSTTDQIFTYLPNGNTFVVRKKITHKKISTRIWRVKTIVHCYKHDHSAHKSQKFAEHSAFCTVQKFTCEQGSKMNQKFTCEQGSKMNQSVQSWLRHGRMSSTQSSISIHRTACVSTSARPRFEDAVPHPASGPKSEVWRYPASWTVLKLVHEARHWRAVKNAAY